VARGVEAAAPENLEALAALSRAYLAAGNEKLAQGTLARMARIAAFDPTWQTRVAEMQLAAGNAPGAVQSLDRALSAQPDFFPAQALMAQVELYRGEIAKADQRARALVKRNADAAALRLLGDVTLAAKNYPEAIEAYRRALSGDDTTEGAIRLYRAYIASGNMAKGNEFLDAWLRARPYDRIGHRALAEGYLRAGDLAAARAGYEALLVRTRGIRRCSTIWPTSC
jgi:predicted Zn-dependent protease